jgi:hypothetical protein
MSSTPEPDIIRVVIERMCSLYPSYPAELAHAVELQVRAEWGGRALGTVRKTVTGRPGRPPIDATVRQRAYAEILTAEPTEAILRRHGISRASLYRLMKRGPAP